ncbi:lipopolysaccharide biosynthesis protein [Acinetobacter soli]
MNLLNNAKWVALSQATKILCQIINLVVLARLIPPAEYGLIAMAGVIVALGFLFRDMGTSAALIQKENLTEELKNAVFWLNVITGIALAILISCISPLVADYFRQTKLVYVLLLLSLTFPIASLSASHLALMERESKFKIIAFIESGSSLIATILAIYAAYNDWGVYSLVVQSLFNALISSILFWNLSYWKPSINGYIYLKEIKQIFIFSGNLVAFNFINYFYRNADRWIIGRTMQSSILGAYDLSYKIMLFPLQTLTFVVGRALFPVISRLQDNDEEFNKTFLRITVFIAMISFPLMVGLFVLRNEFVNIVFGSKWYMVGNILFWLAPIGIMQSLNSSTGGILTAKGKTNILFFLGIVGAVLTLSGFLVATYQDLDIVGFCKLYFVSNLINFFIALFVVCKVIRLSLISYFKAIFPVFLSSLFLLLFLFILNFYIEKNFLNFFLKVILSGFFYLVVLFFFPIEIIDNNFKAKFKKKLRGFR